jgi:peptidoglycan/xylan/chitin deacetylase (PgdA/CDA1 family)
MPEHFEGRLLELLSQTTAKLRNALRFSWMYLLYGSGVLWWAKLRLARRGGIIVLTFHRVLPENQFARSDSPHGMVVREQTFESLARHAASHYQNLRLGDSEGASANGKPRLAFTFDDGWLDNACTAFPIAKKYNIPLAIFICSGLVGKQLPFWPERFMALWRAAEFSGKSSREIFTLLAEARGGRMAVHANGRAQVDWALDTLKQMPKEGRERVLQKIEKLIAPMGLAAAKDCPDATMSWNDIAALAKSGVIFGSHSESHQILPNIPAEEVQHEVSESKRAIAEQLKKECRFFSYPNGDSSSSVRELVAQAGYELAFLNQPGIWTKDTDPYSIPRMNVWEGKLVGPSGAFSGVAFEYTVLWKAYRAGKPPLSTSATR